MPVYSRRYTISPGVVTVVDPDLINVNILAVIRSGMTFYKTFNEEPSDLQYIYSAFGGGLTFKNPFMGTGPVTVPSQLEKVLVKWKV